MKFRLQFSGLLGGQYVEVRDSLTPTEADEVIEFMRKHGDEVWLGEGEESTQFQRVVLLVGDDGIRVEVTFD